MTRPRRSRGIAVTEARVRPSYAVVWRDPAGVRFVGKLELGAQSLELEGAAPDGDAAHVRVPYGDILRARMGRAPSERLAGRPSLLLELPAERRIAIGPVGGPGVALELGEGLAELMELAFRARRATIVAPLKRGMEERVRKLIERGPPFDPEAAALERHAVFVTEREAVFLFEGPEVGMLAARLVRSPAAWRAAAAWERCLAGRPRLAEEVFRGSGAAGP